MSNFNKVILAGRFSRDPELRHAGQTTVCSFSLALNRSYKTDSGEKKEEVTFVDITAFGKQAEVIAQHLRKGDSILVEGRLKTESWDDKQTGQKRTKIGVVLEGFSFLGGKRECGEAPAPRQQAATKPASKLDDDEPLF